MLKVSDPQSYELMNKLATVPNTKQFDWNKLPGNSSWGNLKTLEKLDLIFTKDYSDYVLLYGKIKEIISKVDKS